MKTPALLSAFALVFAAGSALAQEATSDAWMNAASTKSRAQVQTELAQARADGSIKFASSSYMEKIKVAKSRADVATETRAALANGEVARIQAETYAFEAQRPAASSNTRLAQSAR